MEVTDEIVIYQTKDKKIEVSLKEETVWLTLRQIANLFDKDKSVISRHISNIFKTGELSKNSTVAKIATVQLEGNRRIKRNLTYYNLDVIISVGYRVNSKKATQFRIWATQILKNYLTKGYAINKNKITKEKIKELEKTLQFIKDSIYTPVLSKKFDGKELYPSFEEKAANLLYLIIKNHPFVDGNKRIGALLFLLFLNENIGFEKLIEKFNSNGLTALCYLVAGSKPGQKKLLIHLITQMINWESTNEKK